MARLTDVRRQVLAELKELPSEFDGLLLQMIRTYRQSVMLKPARESFAQGWREAQRGHVQPIEELWEA